MPRSGQRRRGPVPALWLAPALALLLVAGVLAAMPGSASAATMGPHYPGSGANVNGPGTQAWSNPGYITAPDASYATATMGAGGVSEYLQGTSFGFTIPLNATINGITVSIMRKDSGPIRDEEVRLLKAGSPVGSNRASSTNWPTSMALATYGSASDLWGTTWTPAEINAGSFGVALSVQNTSVWWWFPQTGTAYVDYIRVSVTHTPGPLAIATGSPLAAGSAGAAYSQMLAASGGTPPYAWSIDSGSLPAGLALDGATGAITGTPTAAGGPADITFRVTDSAAASATKALTIAIARGTPVITWADPADITYGTALGATQLNATASVPGTFVYTPAAGALLPAGSGQALHADFTPSDIANYNTAQARAAINVNPLAITVTAADNSKVYGQSDPALTYTCSPALVAGDSFKGALGREAGQGVGTYAINQGTLSLSSSYTLSYTGASLTISPKALAITARDQAKTQGDTLTFAGDEFTAVGLAYSDAVASVTLTSAGAAAPAPKGTYDIVASNAVGTGLSNYSITYKNGTLTVSTYGLTITAAGASKTYGATYTFTGTEFTVTGLQAGDSVDSVTLTSAGAGASAAAETYDIVAGNAVGTGLEKYTIVYANGILTVGPKNLVIIASNATKTYGDTLIFAGTEFTTAGLVNADTVASVTLFSPGAGAAAAKGTYDIVASNAVGTGLSNYSITYKNGTLTVSIHALTITANSAAKVYGDNLTFAGTEFTVTGLQAGDWVDSVALSSAGAGAGAATGSYTIVIAAATGTGLSKYSIAYSNGILTVDPRGLTITADNLTKPCGEALAFTGKEFTPAGLANSDTVASVTLTSAGAGASAPVGGYAIVPSDAIGTGLGNYNVVFANGSLQVKKGIIITAGSASKVYGENLTFAGTEFTVTGLEGGDTVTSVTLTSAGAGAEAAAGAWDIRASAAVGTGLDSYHVSYASGVLTVTPRALQITASSSTKSGGTTATLTGTEFSASGLVNGDRVLLVTLTSPGAEAAAPGGTYDIVPSGAIGQGLDNYAVTYVNGALTVDRIATVWSITASPAQAARGEPVTITVTITPTIAWSVTPPSVSNLPEGGDPISYDIKLTRSGAIGTLTLNYLGVMMTANVTYIKATGRVTIWDGDTALGTARLVNGTATFTTSDLSAGSHRITASYDGDEVFEGGTTLAHVLTVEPGPGPNWWLIGGTAAGAATLGFFLLLLIFLLFRRRRRRKATAQA